MHLILPSALWLALFLIPAILFFYFLKRKYQDQTISSTLLWNQVLEKVEVNRPWQKLWRHILLWLQLAAALFLIFSLSRPAFPTEGLKAKHTILLIDRSGSMQTLEGKETRLNLAKKEAKKLIANMNPEQSITLIEMGTVPHVLLSQSKDQSELERKVEEIQAQASTSDDQAALTLAQTLTARGDSSEIILIGDGTNQSEDQQLKPNRFIQIGKTKQNVAVGSATAFQQGAQQGIFARVDNYGEQTTAVTLTLHDQTGQLIDTRSITIKPTQSSAVRWEKVPSSLFYHVKLSSAANALSADDEAWVFPQNNQKNKVLLTGKEDYFLNKALQINRSIELLKAETAPEQLEEYSFVILNGGKGKLPNRRNLLVLTPSLNQTGITVKGTAVVNGPIKKKEHPILQWIPLQEFHAAEVKKVQVPTWGETILQAGDIPLIIAGEQQGRKIILFTFDLQKSDLPLQPSYPILMTQVMKWLAADSSVKGIQIQPEAEVQLSIPPIAKEVTLQGNSISRSYPVTDGQVRFQAPEQSGFFELKGSDQAKSLLYLTVPFPQEESNIAPQSVTTAEMTHLTASKGMEEIWWWIVLGALIIIGLEWVVFSRGY